MKKALIFGVTGQDGSYLAEFLLEKGYEVYGVVRKSSSSNTARIDHLIKKAEEEKIPFKLLWGDITDASSINRAMIKVMPDEVYNLAAQSHVGISQENPENTIELTGLAVVKILEAIRNICPKARFFNPASGDCFGEVKEIPQSETTPFNPKNPYSAAKELAHRMVGIYRESFGIFACSGIMYNHESERRGSISVTGKISKGLARIRYGLQKTLYLGNIDTGRDWGHAKDCVEAMWLMLQQDRADDYVIGIGEKHSPREFLEKAAEHMGLKIKSNGKKGEEEKYLDENGEAIVEIKKEFFRPNETSDFLANYEKARKVLGWKPKVGFDGLIKMMADKEMELARKEAGK
ncbi:GDP-mannose 4,6-dehydratase [Candidatus Pacearchaeota archaeon]|nr:GDP-mannose 4,6-dehydratase [Candidatus Pacearchaeota archaeon]